MEESFLFYIEQSIKENWVARLNRLQRGKLQLQRRSSKNRKTTYPF